jgi:uncharacterized membrane protein (DUF485 family)
VEDAVCHFTNDDASDHQSSFYMRHARAYRVRDSTKRRIRHRPGKRQNDPNTGDIVMKSTAGQDIWLSPAFERLVSRRRRLVARLTLGTLVPYYAFVLVAGFAPRLLAARLSGTGVITAGWAVGVLLIVGTWLLTGLYIHRANGEFDALTSEIANGGGR